MGGNIIWMECECPYAQDGKACKHMAAVTKMAMKSDEETVRNYLVSVLMESDNYLLRFKMITDVCSQGDVPVVYGSVKKSREESERKAFCREHWQNTATRMYYIGLCEEEGAYEEALQALDESIAKDRSLSKLQIREKYRQQLNQMAEMMLVAAAGIVFCGRKLYKSR